MTTTIDETHDPARASWVPGADGHADFPVQNLPFGVVSVDGGDPRAVVAIGDHVLDLAAIGALLPDGAASAVAGPTLNALFARPAEDRRALRRRLSALLADEAHRAAIEPALHPAGRCTPHLPCAIGDYSDFYVGIHHAENIGRQFRPDTPLLPNYKYVPIGYHGRASSVRVSGTDVVRPSGQRRPPDAAEPSFGPTRRLDYELELGVWIGAGSVPGEPVPIGAAGGHVAGFSLLNDWSARDMQGWEYQPLGPFLSKSFHTSLSPWVVTPEALAPFRVAQPPRPAGDPAPLPYLWDEADQAAGGLGLTLEVYLRTATMRAAGLPPHRLSHGDTGAMYWTVAQMVTHHASNGCNLRSGDLLGTGTLSMPRPDGYGSLTELSRAGSVPLALPGGEERGFLEDGDEVILTGRAERAGYATIGLGRCVGMVLPAR